MQPAEPVGPDYVTVTPDEVIAEETALRAILHYSEALIDTGRSQLAYAVSILGRVGAIEALKRVRDSKKYIGLPYTDDSGNLRRVGDIEEYCTAFLGRSYSSIMEDDKHLRTLGRDGFAKAIEFGLTTKQLRQIEKLPDDQQAIVKEAMTASDKDAVLDILERYVVKSTAEKETLKKERDDARAESAGRDKVIVEKNRKIDELDIHLHKRESQAADERAEALTKQLQEAMNTLTSKPWRALTTAIEMVLDWEEAPQHLVNECNQKLNNLETLITEYRLRHNLVERAYEPGEDAWLEEARAEVAAMKAAEKIQ